MAGFWVSQTFGLTCSVTTDQGSQLVAAAEGEGTLNWNTVQHGTASTGTTWNFVPAGTPWRNGSAERLIGVLKKTMVHQVAAGALLSSMELQSFLHMASAIANERPLTARSFTVEDFMAITPRDLLLGAAPSLPRMTDWEVGTDEDWESRGRERLSRLEEKVELWWRIYAQDAFPLLVPFWKWSQAEESVDLGAIVLIQYATNFKKDRYRLGRVVELEVGRDGLVRSVVVLVRNCQKGAREHLRQCKAGTTRLRLPVQRVVLVIPGSEQPKELVDQLRQTPAVRRERPGSAQGGGLRVRTESEEEEILDLV